MCASMVRYGGMVLLCLWFLIACAVFAQERAFPGKEWERIKIPEESGYSNAKLEALRGWLKTQPTKSLFVSLGGRSLFEYGETAHTSIVASVRKSVLGMMYGKHVVNGTIDLDKTVTQLGLDDVSPFLPREQFARLDLLLLSRSGIYHPNQQPDDDPIDYPPARGSQFPGAFYFYNNWDFNAAGTAFEKLTGKGIYDALRTDLAEPIGMQDYDVAKQKKTTNMPHSKHPLYHMYLSTRDMARLGLLMLRGGLWGEQRVLPQNWSSQLTHLWTPAAEIFPMSLRWAQTRGPWRWGYGRMWWVWDSPKIPGGLEVNAFDNAYAAFGLGGQMIVVLPSRDLVIAHKVEIEGPNAADMPFLEQATLVQLVITARCTDGRCK